jgi:hypothetical protein
MNKDDLIQLRHHEIDKVKWDAAIARAIHPLIYAESWYLDVVSPQWEAIVTPDYSTLWPLTINRKFKWPVIMQPMFTQQLGIFSSAPISKENIAQIYKANPYPILTLQSHGQYEWPKSALLSTKNNSVLPLQKDYAELQKSFRKDRKQSLAKALKNPTTCDSTTSTEAFINFTRKHNNYRLPEKHLMMLHQLISRATEYNSGFILSVADGHEEPLSMAFFLRKYKRIINLSGHSSSKGFAKEGMFQILNQVIKDYAASDYLLDFEGSEIKGIASFYSGFGAIPEPYLCHQHPLLSYTQKLKKLFTQKNI